MPRTDTSVMKILKGDGKHNHSYALTRGRDKSTTPPNPEITTSKPDFALTSADKVTVLLLTYAVYIWLVLC